MGSTFGKTILETTGRSIQLTADGIPEVKAGGVTIDWSTVAAVAGADVTLLDGLIVKIGEKYLRYGQVITRITASGKFGPYDPGAADGRQLLARGDAYLMNETIKEDEVASNHPPGCLEGGLVFAGRVLQTGVAAHTLVGGPTLAEFLAVFPRIRMVNENP